LAAIEKLKVDHSELIPCIKGAAGLSLGEYTALVFSGAMTWEDGLRVVKVRAEAMQQASEKTPSAMASIVGLEENLLAKLIEEVVQQTGGKLKIANFLSAGNRTIAGDLESIEHAIILAKSSKYEAKFAKKLLVSGAFHTEYMSPASEALSEILSKTNIRQPTIPVISNVDAKPHENVEFIKSALQRQLVCPVLWEQTMQGLLSDGFQEFVEVGVGSVLSDLTRRIAQCINVKVKVTTINS